MNRLFIILLLLLTSCTATLWGQPNNEVEYLNGFYVNKDIHVLLASTDEHGYLFPISEDFEQILSLSRSVLLQPTFGRFTIDSNREVSGYLTLILPEETTSKKDLEQLQQLGFTRNLYNQKLSFSVMLKGKQYDIDGDLPLVKLENKYKILINNPGSFSGSASKIIATPATIAFDMVVVLPASFLLAAFWVTAEN